MGFSHCQSGLGGSGVIREIVVFVQLKLKDFGLILSEAAMPEGTA